MKHTISNELLNKVIKDIKCSSCKGRGYITENYGLDGRHTYECPRCKGTGKGTLKDIDIFKLAEKCKKLELPLDEVIEAFR